MRIWANNPISKAKAAADIKLKRTKKNIEQAVATSTEQQTIAAKRAEENEKLEREIAERKAGAVSYEEYLKMKEA